MDIKILSAVQRNGRITVLKLSEHIGLSSSPSHARLRRLESCGVINSYRAEIDLDRLMHTISVIVPVELTHHEAKDFKRFEDRIREVPEVVECSAVGGGFDYILRIVTRDIESYQRLMDQFLDDEIGIRRYYSYVVTKAIKRNRGYPLENLLDAQDAMVLQE